MSSSSSLDNLPDLQEEQICHVKCCFCNSILRVGVPHSSLAMVVKIGCGHCNNIFSFDMMKACLPIPLSSSLNQHDQILPISEVCTEQFLADNKALGESLDEEEYDQDAVFKPAPEKKLRAPTKYNMFIKEEIKRLKTVHPNMTHRQAFSAASKNWAHCPQIEYGQEEELNVCHEGGCR